ncbi:MAG: hypothetical protein JJU22_08130 [Gammaproteobacteria bacterium]|nr:hypothetical protein [Gammaproteobacteria bacterium]
MLEEVRPAVFHLDGKDFIHFHENGPEALVADVRLTRGRVRMPVATTQQQAELMERIEQKLGSLEQRSEKPPAGGVHHKRGDTM